MIARTLGTSIKNAKREVNSQEFATWRAAYELEPWGEGQADYRAARLAQVIASTYGGKLTLADSLKLLDRYDYDEPPANVAGKFRAFFNVNAEFKGVSTLGAGKRRGAK